MLPTTHGPEEMDINDSLLLQSLDGYVERYYAGTINDSAKAVVKDAINEEVRVGVYQAVADNIWDKYSVVDVDLAILILRKWLSIDPENREAKRTLGSYLLAHGPDWDQEGNTLLKEASGSE